MMHSVAVPGGCVRITVDRLPWSEAVDLMTGRRAVPFKGDTKPLFTNLAFDKATGEGIVSFTWIEHAPTDLEARANHPLGQPKAL